MKLNWTINTVVAGQLPSSNGLCAYFDERNIMATVYRCLVDRVYYQIVWIAGDTRTYSKSSHACCISAMAHAEAAVAELADKLASKSSARQEF